MSEEFNLSEKIGNLYDSFGISVPNVKEFIRREKAEDIDLKNTIINLIGDYEGNRDYLIKEIELNFDLSLEEKENLAGEKLI